MKLRLVYLIFLLAGFLFVPSKLYAINCPNPNQTGDLTLTTGTVGGSGCTFVGSAAGVLGGNLTVSGVTLTISANQTLVYNQGYSITIDKAVNSYISMPADYSGKIVKKGYVCVTDADGDGYPASIAPDTQVYSVTACASPLANRATIAHWASDCNDGSASVYVNATCYADADGDTYTKGSAQSICGTSTTCGAGYTATQKQSGGIDDCNDTAGTGGTVWATISGNCYQDSDNDGYGAFDDSVYTCGNNATCTTATAASVGTGTPVTATFFEATNTDRCDIDFNAKPSIATCSALSATQIETNCGTHDWDSDGVETVCTTTAYSTTTPCNCPTSCNVTANGWTAGTPANCSTTGTYNKVNAPTYALSTCYNNLTCVQISVGATSYYPDCK